MSGGGMRVAVIGEGLSGLVASHVLTKAGVDVVLYHTNHHLAANLKTVTFDDVELDVGFLFLNPATYANMIELFEDLGIDMEPSDMSFSVSLLENGKGFEWGTRNGFSALFAQKKNVFNPYFWQMAREISKFKDQAIKYLELLENSTDIDRNETLGHFIESRGYTKLFQKAYLVPICTSVWSCPTETAMGFSAFSVLSFFHHNHLLQLFGRRQWLTLKQHMHYYINKVKKELESRGCQIKTGHEVYSVSTTDEGCTVCYGDNCQELYNGCIMTVHAPDAIKMLGSHATSDEMRILGAFQYVYSDLYLHRDKIYMPQNPATWSAWNFLRSKDGQVCLTYWLNVLQNIGDTNLSFFVTINPPNAPENTLLKWSAGHPVPSVAAFKASLELDDIQGKRGIWFCGPYQGHSFHEDELKAGMVAAYGILGKSSTILKNPKNIVHSLAEAKARRFVTKFLERYISSGTLILLEGGTVLSFAGTGNNGLPKSIMKVHNPHFYWKIMTEADIGLAVAYINGDVSFVDKDKGLLNLLLLLLASKQANYSVSKLNKRRGWWTPFLYTAGISSAKYFFKHALRKNTLKQARKNISHHYDTSNEFFALCLGETMQYSCAFFESEDEELKVAQLRKMSVLIEKARIDKNHEVLEIGCGWGTLAIEIVRQTGCKYTGITLSKEQLKFAEMKVKEAGLQDSIRFLLCDYRNLPQSYKYDRIISCEMIEAIGHEYIEEFFGCCDSALAEDGIFVLQFTSVPDADYDEHRLTSGFITEFIFPGGCLPSLSRITSAMAAASRLCVENVENNGIHLYKTMRCWRQNLLEKQSEIIALGFNEEFIRTWEYYFDYCGAGFKLQILGNYQVVLSRPGNSNLLNTILKIKILCTRENAYCVIKPSEFE